MAETIDGAGERPNGIAVAGGAIWVIGDTRTTVTRIDIATRRAVGVPPTVGLGASSIVAAGSSVWVAAKDARRVFELDAGTGRIVRGLRPGAPPTRLAAGAGSLWVGTVADGSRPPELVRYDLTGTERDRLHDAARRGGARDRRRFRLGRRAQGERDPPAGPADRRS